MAKLTINHKTIEIQVGKSLFVQSGDDHVFIPSSCKKIGLCKECVLRIEKGNEFLNTPSIFEKHLSAPYRLACQATFVDQDAHVVCSTLKRDEITIDEGLEESDRLVSVKKLNPAVIRDQSNNICLDNQIIDNTTGAVLGLAIDIGTTTVVLRLLDLETGEIKGVASFENPQRFAGSNIMSRIQFDVENKSKQLKRILISYISDAIIKLCKTPEKIYEVIVGGNSTMRDIFFGIDVASLGQSPYISLTQKENGTEGNICGSLSRKAKEMHFPIHPDARIFSLPLIGNHIGSDVTAGLLAVDFFRMDKPVAFIDIGTNTEIIISNNKQILATSSPSGPAFEGGGITFGMPALRGAIEKFTLCDHQPKINVIGNTKALGICGSGLIDVLGELLKSNFINSSGRFNDDHVWDDKIKLDGTGDIFITENDINQLAQAKGANAAALRILVDQLNLELTDIDTYYLAGGFGKYINLENSKRIGLLPNVDNSKFIRLGNACINGLSLALLDKNIRTEIEESLKQIKMVNLEKTGNFFDYFAEECQFSKMGNITF